MTKLEEENTNLKAALDAANQEVSRLKSDKTTLNDKASELMRKKNDLEAYLGGLAKKLFLMLEGNPLYQTKFFNCNLRLFVLTRWLCLQNFVRTLKRRLVDWK